MHPQSRGPDRPARARDRVIGPQADDPGFRAPSGSRAGRTGPGFATVRFPRLSLLKGRLTPVGTGGRISPCAGARPPEGLARQTETATPSGARPLFG